MTDHREHHLVDLARTGVRDLPRNAAWALSKVLRPAGAEFRRDLAQTAATREVYEQNTAAAAARVQELIDEGIRAGAFRPVSAALVGEVVTATMRRITSGEIGRATGLDDAQAYAELARLVVAAVRR